MRYTLILAALITNYAAASDLASLNPSDNTCSVEVLEADLNRTILDFKVNGYEVSNMNIDGVSYIQLHEPSKESMIEKKGYPRLPRICRSIIIPDDGVMDWKLISADYIEIENIDIAPSKGHLMRTVDPAVIPFEFAEIYEQDTFYPSNLVNIREPYIMRDFRGIVVEVNAFQYNPVQRVLRIYTDVVVGVYKKAAGGENVLLRRHTLDKFDFQFHKIYRQNFINFDDLDYTTLLEAGEMLVVCYDEFLDELEPLVEWKNQKGISTELIALSQIGGTHEQIKAYIEDVYLSGNLTYVLLVGDAQQVPTFPELEGSDPLYTLLEGNDYYPEVIAGRFSAENLEEIRTQVERTLHYEKYPQLGADWYHKGLGAASDQGAGYGHHGEADYEHITIIARKLLGYTYTQIDSAYAPWGTAEIITASLNEGRSIFNYCGHGYEVAFGPPEYRVEDIDQLTNANKLPFVISVACLNGAFTNTTCIAETWLRATHNMTAEPTGAIAVYASRQPMFWVPGMDMQDEAVDLFVADSMFTFGGLCYNGSGLMLDLNGDDGAYDFSNLTIFGDPSVYLRSTTPFELTVVHDSVFIVGASALDIEVSCQERPLEAAMVCIMNDEIYESGFTDENGHITLEFNPPPCLLGTFTLTVTRSNPIPYIVELPIIPPDGPYVVYEDHFIQDDLTGNNNGQLDYAEMVELALEVENVGNQSISNISCIISTDDTLVTVLRDSAFFGEIQAGTTRLLERAFEIVADTTIDDGHIVQFNLTATDGFSTWPSLFQLVLHSPQVVYNDLLISGSGGNFDAQLEPGETGDFTLLITNEGTTDALDLTFELTSDEPLLSIPQNSVILNCLEAQVETTIVYPSITADETISQGEIVNFTLDITGAYGYLAAQQFSLQVGDVRYDPVGPDEYGYCAFDKYDWNGNPDFQWLEIAPQAGGEGIVYPLGNEEVVVVQLPFPFRYYGEEFTQATICSQGWLALDTVSAFYPHNLPIPNYAPPNSLIAAFWDELSPSSGGQICSYYNNEGNQFIVEWYQVPHIDDPAEDETFQIVLHDPLVRPTPTGDGEIEVAYLAVSNLVDECTAGIEDPTGTIGIEYLRDGTYHPNAMPLEDSLTIQYTTDDNPVAVAYPSLCDSPAEFSLFQNYPNPFNPTTTIGYALPALSNVELSIFNVQGQLVETLIDKPQPAGYYQIDWNASQYSSGLYLCCLEAGAFRSVRKILLLK
jgi:hypothetical protein